MRLVFVRESDLDLMGGVMTSALFTDGRPLTEDEFLAIDEGPERIELFDGSLHVTPGPSPLHQNMSRRLANALDRAADALGFEVFEAVNVRLRPDRILIPDIVITSPINQRDPVIDASAVHMVCEVLSPSNAVTDRVTKMHYYASAGIPWYLLVDPDSRVLQLNKLVGETYTEHSVGRPGKILQMTEPVKAILDPAVLLPK
jgi:Uma2 family endonuclease